MKLLSPYVQYLISGIEPVTVFLTNGVKLSGIITAYDNSSLVLARDGISQLVMFHAIATVMPQNAFAITEVLCDEVL